MEGSSGAYVKALNQYLSTNTYYVTLRGSYVGEWIGTWRHLGYGVPELPLDCS
jgi:hypothetical protein